MFEKFIPLAKLAEIFEEHFQPSSEKYGSSELYHDYANQSSFYPNAKQTRDCLIEYTKLIELAVSLTQTRADADTAADYLMNASELLLGYFERCDPKSILEYKHAAQITADSAKYLLLRAKDTDLDQSHRLIAVGQWLAENAGIEFTYSYKDTETDN